MAVKNIYVKDNNSLRIMSHRTLQKFKSGSFFTIIPPAFIETIGAKEGDDMNVILRNNEIIIKKKFFDDVDKGLQLAVDELRKDLKKK